MNKSSFYGALIHLLIQSVYTATGVVDQHAVMPCTIITFTP